MPRVDVKGLPSWSHKLVRTAMVDPRTLQAHPLNSRRHPPAQRTLMRAILSDIGWVKAVKVNLRTGNLFNGHMRVEEAIARGEALVPVSYYDISEQEELDALATYDPLGSLARRQEDKLAALVGKVRESGHPLSRETTQALANMADAAAAMELLDDPPGDVPEAPPPETAVASVIDHAAQEELSPAAPRTPAPTLSITLLEADHRDFLAGLDALAAIYDLEALPAVLLAALDEACGL